MLPSNIQQYAQQTAMSGGVNPLGQLAYPVMHRQIAAIYRISAGHSIANNTHKALNADTKLRDTHDAVVTGVDVWRFIAPATGFYNLHADAGYVSTAWTAGEAAFMYYWVDGANPQYPLYYRDDINATTIVSMRGSDVVFLETGQFVRVMVYQNTGAAVALLYFPNAVYGRISIALSRYA